MTVLELEGREAALDARALYPDLIAADAPFPTNSPLPERGAYVVGYVDGRPLACGALWPCDFTTAEVPKKETKDEKKSNQK